ncbi:MAG: hypothetical protein KatS3mg019_0094 [Fimbriimonadales bacterium]|nr:MAG: hypothetical protein KatS3mg019_0094 [Fimbriimonadales bacterium]
MVNLDALRKEIFGVNGFVVKLRREFGLDSPQRLAERTQEVIRRQFGRVTCKNVNDVLCALLDQEYEVYKELEQQAITHAVQIALQFPEFEELHQVISAALKAVRDDSLAAEERLTIVGQNLAGFYKLLSESFAQSRRTRAGGSAQYHIDYVLQQLGYRGVYEKQQVLNGTVDFLFPSLDQWKKDRRMCVIVSIKRSLRERYKQVFEELNISKGLTVYLIVTETENEAQRDITLEKVEYLDQHNIYLVVRDAVKIRFTKQANVLGFTDFFCKQLRRLRQRWRGS